jgi:hypothetical protein
MARVASRRTFVKPLTLAARDLGLERVNLRCQKARN